MTLIEEEFIMLLNFYVLGDFNIGWVSTPGNPIAVQFYEVNVKHLKCLDVEFYDVVPREF